MKKAISLLICVSLLLSLTAVFSAASEPDETGFAVASDLHYSLPREQLEGEIDDPIYWYANRRASMDDESGFIIDEFLSQCAADSSCEFVLISGDLADNGRRIPQEHLDMAAKLAAFEGATGKQVYVINGNHDASENSMTTFADFKRIYADFGYNEALVTDEKTCSYTADLGDKYRLIALDSCDDTASTEDGMSVEKLEWVHTQTVAAKSDGRYPILMMHHNLLDHMPIQRIINRNFIVRFHLTTASLFADWGIRIVLTGHEHCSDATVYTSAAGNKIYDFATTALTMYPLQYRSFTLTDSEIKYSAKTVDSIDTLVLRRTVSGYSDEQIALMNAGLNSYAKGFLKAGVRYRLELSLSMEKIGIAPDDLFYNLVNTAVSGLTDILEMPLYGEGGACELAKKYNIDLPQSDYENAWDLATEFVATHYAGEEAIEMDSTELTILLRTAALILRTDLAKVSDEVFLSGANKLIAANGSSGIADSLTRFGTSVFGAVTPGEYFILAVASPLISEFAFDSDGINDNSGTLPGYGTAIERARAVSFLPNLFYRIILFFSRLFK